MRSFLLRYSGQLTLAIAVIVCLWVIRSLNGDRKVDKARLRELDREIVQLHEQRDSLQAEIRREAGIIRQLQAQLQRDPTEDINRRHDEILAGDRDADMDSLLVIWSEYLREYRQR